MTITHGTDDLRQTIAPAQRASFLWNCWRAFQAWRERGRIAAELSRLSDRELIDIGITHGEICYFVSNGMVDRRPCADARR